MSPSANIVLLVTFVGPLLGSALAMGPLAAMQINAPAVEKSADKTPPCVTTLERYDIDCPGQKNIEFRDERVWKPKNQHPNKNSNIFMLFWLTVIGGYLVGLIPAFLSSLYPALSLKKQTRINPIIYFTLPFLLSGFFGALFSWGSNFSPIVGVVGVVTALLFYPFIKKIENQVLSLKDGSI